jgi:hypothetical protein
MGLGEDPVDVIAIDALKGVHLESDPRGLDVRQDHWAQTFGTLMGLDCDAVCVEQDCQG